MFFEICVYYSQDCVTCQQVFFNALTPQPEARFPTAPCSASPDFSFFHWTHTPTVGAVSNRALSAKEPLILEILIENPDTDNFLQIWRASAIIKTIKFTRKRMHHTI